MRNDERYDNRARNERSDRRTNYRPARNTATESSMSETDHSDHDERVLAVIDRRQPPEFRSFATAVKGGTPNNNGNQRRLVPDEPIHERLALSRRNSRRNMDHDRNRTRESWGTTRTHETENARLYREETHAETWIKTEIGPESPGGRLRTQGTKKSGS